VTLIGAADDKCERYASIALIQQTWVAQYSTVTSYSLRIPIYHILKVNELNLDYADGTKSVYNMGYYHITGHRLILDIVPIAHRLFLRFEAGFGASEEEVPASLKATMLEHVASLYENRAGGHLF